MTNSKNGFSKVLKSNVPDGPIDKKWTSHKNKINLGTEAIITIFNDNLNKYFNSTNCYQL